MTGDMTSRRTVEALRAGVPSGDAVAQLGCDHPEIERRFQEALDRSVTGIAAGSQPIGLLVGGDFGSGKSHLLQYLAHVAGREGFACSKIVISKETSLADPIRVFRAAVAEVRVPGRVGTGIGNIASALNFNRSEYGDFYHWAGSPESGLVDQLAASLFLFEYGKSDTELRERLTRFWAGDPFSNAELRRNLLQVGKAADYNLGRLPAQKDLAFQRFRFLLRMACASGYRGWVLLIDEVELIGQYGQKQRAKAYQELARWMGLLRESGEVFPGLVTVAAITNDFESAVLLGGKSDAEDIPGRLRASPREEDAVLATRAERGMRAIQHDRLPLSRLTQEIVVSAHDRLRKIYSEAFQWEAPPVLEHQRPLATSDVMRPLVRRWITQWDLLRLYPDYSPDIREEALRPESYDEDKDLEEATEGS